jgi:high-affinity iron transporter
LIALTAEPDRLNDVSYQVTTLLQDIEDLLPGLPTTRDEQQVTAVQNTGNTPTAQDDIARADWAAVSLGIHQSIQKAIARYQEAMRRMPFWMCKTLTALKLAVWKTKSVLAIRRLKPRWRVYFTRLVSL